VTGSTVSTADVGIAGTAAPDPAVVDDVLTYTLTVTNGGPDTAQGVSLVDTLPSQATFTSAQATQGTCSQVTGVVTCSLGDIAPAKQAVTSITVGPTAPGALKDVAAVTSTTLDPNPQNNSLALSTLVDQTGTPKHFRPDLLIGKQGGRLLGGDVYNRTARGQRLKAGLRRRHSARVVVVIQNDGSAADDVVVSGPGSGKGFSVTYLLGTTNITRRVTGRGFTVRGLRAGGERRVRMVVTALRRARAGTTRTWLVTGTSRGDPLQRDAVKLSLTVRRG